MRFSDSSTRTQYEYQTGNVAICVTQYIGDKPASHDLLWLGSRFHFWKPYSTAKKPTELGQL